MKHAILTWIAIAWAGLLLSSVVSMMAVFLGSGSGDLRGLLQVQLAMIPVMLVALVLYLWRTSQFATGERTSALLWRHVPGWLVFTVTSAAALTLIAELTLVLLQQLLETPRPWLEHVPATTALISAVTLAVAVAALRLERPSG